MRRFFLIIAMLLPVAPAFATSKQQIREGRAGCVKFLRLAKAEQVKVAKRAGYSLAQTQQACRLLVNQSVDKTWRDARRPAPPRRTPKPTQPEHNPWNPPACGGSRDCMPGAHCISGYCQSTVYSCSSDTNCGSFETCVEGVCK